MTEVPDGATDRRSFLKSSWLASATAAAVGFSASLGAEKDEKEFVPKQGRNIFTETGVDEPDTEPTWYAPMVDQPHTPVFQILATKGTRGRYYRYAYPVTIKDMVKFHGHDCEGISHCAACCSLAFQELFPEGVVDRSVLGGISGTGPCWSDGVAYLTGARIQYGNLAFFGDDRYNHAVLVYREDVEKAVLATWKKGINTIPGEPVMLPESIDWQPEVDTGEIRELKKHVKGGNPTAWQVDRLRWLQWKHVNDIQSRPLRESYQLKALKDFTWKEWIDETKTIPNPHERSDVKLKNAPFRERPVSGADQG